MSLFFPKFILSSLLPALIGYFLLVISAFNMTSLTKQTVSSPRKKRNSKNNSFSYQSRYVQELLAFFDISAFTVTEVMKKDGSVALIETAAELPTFAAFARKLGVTQEVLTDWERQYPEFAQAAQKARDLQGNILIQNSLRGNYSSSFAVFTAKNLLGWHDGKEEGKKQPSTLVVHWEE